MVNKIDALCTELENINNNAVGAVNGMANAYKSNIFGRAIVKKDDFEKRIYAVIHELSRQQAELHRVFSEFKILEAELVHRLDALYSSDDTENVARVQQLAAQVEKCIGICISISEDCIDSYAHSLEGVRDSVFGSAKSSELDVSVLHSLAKSFNLRITQYTKLLYGG